MEVSDIQKQLDMGAPIEHEHTKNQKLAIKIALQHLDEIPDYYTRLKKMEVDAKKHHKKFKDMKEALDGKSAKDPDYSLKDWFKDGGWVQAGGKYDGKPCAKQPGQKTKPFCRDADDRASMSKEERNKRAAKKRKEDPNPNRKGKAKFVSASYEPQGGQIDELWGKVAIAAGAAALPYLMKKFAKPAVDKAIDAPATGSGTLVDTLKQRKKALQKNSYEPEGDRIDEKKDACYKKVKSRYDVWPSAYASGALVKCRKVGATNWGTKTEETQMIRYCPKCEKDETRDVCRYGPKYWDMFSLPSRLSPNQMKFSIAQVHPANESKEPDHEYSMARSELSTIISAAKRLRGKLNGEGNIEAWVQSKITKAADYIDAAADYLDSGEHNVQGSMDEACWKGYKKKGMKTMFGKRYPNCVKVEESNDVYSNWREDFGLNEASAAWQRKAGKNPEGGLNAAGVASYRAQNPGSKLQTAVTTKPSKLKPGSKDAKRRKSFCARMGGNPGPMKDEKGRPTRKALSLRKWNCN